MLIRKIIDVAEQSTLLSQECEKAALGRVAAGSLSQEGGNRFKLGYHQHFDAGRDLRDTN